MTERINEIEERLSKATPGPWRATGRSKRSPKYKVRGTLAGGPWNISDCPFVCEGDECYGEDEARTNADLIANAPTDIRWLLDALKRVTAESEICRAFMKEKGLLHEYDNLGASVQEPQDCDDDR